MTTTPLPPLPRITEDPFRYYTADQMQAHATAARADLEAENARLREALNDAATSLETIQLRSYGEDSNLSTMLEVRGYAGNRAKVARAALKDTK